MLKTRPVPLILALALATVALAPAASGHTPGAQVHEVDGFKIGLATEPSEPKAGDSATLVVSAECKDDGKHVGGTLKVVVKNGDATELSSSQSLGNGQESQKFTTKFDSAGARTVKVEFTEKEGTVCATATGAGPHVATFSVSVDDKSFLPAPAPLLALAGVAATALLLRSAREE